jgi:hypothetical protein
VGGVFTLVYLVLNTIENVTTQDEQVAVFGNTATHLTPGGRYRLPWSATSNQNPSAPRSASTPKPSVPTENKPRTTRCQPSDHRRHMHTTA